MKQALAMLLLTLACTAGWGGAGASRAWSQDVEPDVGETVEAQVSDGPRGPSYGFRFDSGDGVATRQSFWTPQIFAPLLERSDTQFVFADLRGIFQDDALRAANFGLGARMYSELWERTWGVYVYYDYRDTGQAGFQQVSPGVELLGEAWDLRANVYLPQVGPHHRSLPNQFVGNYLYVDRFQTALSGADLELGRSLPWEPDIRVFGGGYLFQGPGVDDIHGWKVRAEAQWTDVVSTNVTVQHDDSFGTSVNAWAAFRFPSGRTRVERGDGAPRFYEPVQRFQNIVVRNDAGTPASNPANGQPLFFLHVAGGGHSDGSFESPYGTLTEALDDPRYAAGLVDVIYVRQNPAARLDQNASLVHAGDVHLVPNSQLLGNGPLQRVTTQQGLQLLPFSGVDQGLERLPTIAGAVFLADRTTLSGFDIATPASNSEYAVVGVGVADLNVNHNRINFTELDLQQNDRTAIRLDSVFGSLTIADNRIGRFSRSGVSLVNSHVADGRILNNVVNQEQSDFPPLEATRVATIGSAPARPELPPEFASAYGAIDVDSTEFHGRIAGNNVQQNNSTGLMLFFSQVSGDITANQLSRNALNGLQLERSRFVGTIADNQLHGNAGGGILIRDEPGSTAVSVQGNLVRNTANGNSMAGLAIYDARVVGDIAHNTFNESLTDSGLVLSSANLIGDLASNVFDGNYRQGIAVFGTPDIPSVIHGDISQNLVTRSGYQVEPPSSGSPRHDGFTFAYSSFTGQLLQNRIANNEGIGLAMWLTDFQGSIVDNDIVDNVGNGVGVFQASHFVGDIVNNRINGNKDLPDSDGFIAGSFNLSIADATFQGDIRFNQLNDGRIGVLIGKSRMIGAIVDNGFSRNRDVAAVLSEFKGESRVDFSRNLLVGNNPNQASEFFAGMQPGDGRLTMTFDGNRVTNLAPLGGNDYELVNNTGDAQRFILYQGTNVGNVQASGVTVLPLP